MGPVFFILAAITVLSAAAAMSLRNLVHCALLLSLTFIGLAAIFLNLGAQFVGFAQVLVYVGAVAILILFAILLTRGGEAAPGSGRSSGGFWSGFLVAALAFAVLATSVLHSASAMRPKTAIPEVTVKQIGMLLLTDYVLPLQVVGLLLTVAMIGAVLIAMQERPRPRP